MSTKAEVLLSIHILAAVFWVGGNLFSHVLLARAKAADDADKLGYLGRETGWVGQRLFSASSLILLITGGLLVDELGYEFGQFWIIFALVVLLASFIVGVAFLGPQGEKLGGLIAREGLSEARRKQLDKVLVVARVEVLFLVLVVIDMAVKPGLG